MYRISDTIYRIYSYCSLKCSVKTIKELSLPVPLFCICQLSNAFALPARHLLICYSLIYLMLTLNKITSHWCGFLATFLYLPIALQGKALDLLLLLFEIFKKLPLHFVLSCTDCTLLFELKPILQLINGFNWKVMHFLILAM